MNKQFLQMRYWVTLFILLFLHLSPGLVLTSQAAQGIEPCLAKNMPQISMLPANVPIVQVMGHMFRKQDKCAPFYVTFSWENHYDRGDGYTHYSLNYTHTFPGELWYRTDKEEFTLTGNPEQWQGLSKIRTFTGYGQVCTRFDDKGACEDLRKFDRDQVRAKTTPVEFLSSVSYSYPAITTRGQSVPITFSALSPLFEFRNSWHTWQPDGGLMEINNPALINIDFAALTKAAADWESYTVTVSYNNNNDLSAMPSGHKGKLTIKFDFDRLCDGENNKDDDHCQQIQALLNEFKSAIELRDLYTEVLPDATDEHHLEELVFDQLRLRHPYMSDSDVASSIENSAGTNPKTLEITIPEYCIKCAASPLCQWRGEMMEVHENTHVDFLLLNPDDRTTLITDPGILPAKQHGLDKARITAEMEYRAYNKHAMYLSDLIDQQLRQSTGCALNPQFYADLDELNNKLDTTVTIKKPPKP